MTKLKMKRFGVNTLFFDANEQNLLTESETVSHPDLLNEN